MQIEDLDINLKSIEDPRKIYKIERFITSNLLPQNFATIHTLIQLSSPVIVLGETNQLIFPHFFWYPKLASKSTTHGFLGCK